MGRDVNGRGFNPCDPAGLGELEAVSQNLGGKGETVDYPELRLLYHPPSEGKGKVALGQSCDWPKLDNATVMSVPMCCEMETPDC